jgi:hypothetical protein
VTDRQCDQQAGQREARQRPPERLVAEPNLTGQAREDEMLDLFDGLQEEVGDGCGDHTDQGAEDEQDEIASAPQ